MRMAQLAQVMPPRLSSTWLARLLGAGGVSGRHTAVLFVWLAARRAGAGGHVEGERRGAHHALVLEVEEQPVGARARDVHGEGDLLRGGVLGRVDVQVGVVGGPDGDQVPVGAQVRLQVA